jgi:hypothetical protein
MWYDIQNLLYTYFGAESYNMSYFLSIGKKIYPSIWNFTWFTDFTLFSTQVDIKSVLLENSPHHNSSTKRVW